MGWLQVETGTSRSWSVDVDGGSGPETYTSDPTMTNPVDQLSDLVTWCNALVRGWWPFVTFGYRVDSRSTGRASLVLFAYAAQTFDFTPNAAAVALMGWAAHAAATETSPSDLAGGWYPSRGVHLRGWLRRLDKGSAAGTGALLPGDPGSAICRAKTEALASVYEVPSLHAILRQATLPRTALVLHDLSGEWLPVALGALEQEELDPQVYRIRLDVQGA